MRRNSKIKMTVLSPYKKTAGLIYLIYAKETPRHRPGTLTRNKNATQNPKADLASRHPCFLPPAAPQNKADIHPCQQPSLMFPMGRSPAAQYHTLAPTCHGQGPPRMARDAPSPWSQWENPEMSPNGTSSSGPLAGLAGAPRESRAGPCGCLGRVRE